MTVTKSGKFYYDMADKEIIFSLSKKTMPAADNHYDQGSNNAIDWAEPINPGNCLYRNNHPYSHAQNNPIMPPAIACSSPTTCKYQDGANQEAIYEIASVAGCQRKCGGQ